MRCPSVSSTIAAGLFDAGGAAVWSEGDFNYDGSFDILDAADFLSTELFDEGFYGLGVSGLLAAGASAGSLGEQPVAAVPEPSGVVVAGLGVGLGILAWARRSSG